MTPQERTEFAKEVAEALFACQPPPRELSDEEREWVRMAIQREAQSIALRRAIIEKSLSSLIWAAIVGVGYVFLDFLNNHGVK